MAADVVLVGIDVEALSEGGLSDIVGEVVGIGGPDLYDRGESGWGYFGVGGGFVYLIAEGGGGLADDLLSAGGGGGDPPI